MKHHYSLSPGRFLRQVSFLPVIPDSLTPVLFRLGQGWRVGEPWVAKPKKTVQIVFIEEPSDLEVAVNGAEHRI